MNGFLLTRGVWKCKDFLLIWKKSSLKQNKKNICIKKIVKIFFFVFSDFFSNFLKFWTILVNKNRKKLKTWPNGEQNFLKIKTTRKLRKQKNLYHKLGLKPEIIKKYFLRNCSVQNLLFLKDRAWNIRWTSCGGRG